MSPFDPSHPILDDQSLHSSFAVRAHMPSTIDIPASSIARALVVDDTVIYRRIVSDVLQEIPGVDVVGTAVNGRIALEKIIELHPDVVTLDVEMPELNGVQVLEEIKRRGLKTSVIMLSARSPSSAAATTAALALGAFDFVLKPEGSLPQENRAMLREKLAPRIEAALARAGKPRAAHAPVQERKAPASVIKREPHLAGQATIVAIGISTGGPEALNRMLPKLPADLAAPVLIVQHMPPIFTQSLADELNRRCALEVREAVDGEWIQRGVALIAPGGRQMKLAQEDGGYIIRLTDDPPECACRPSVDYLFRSISQLCPESALAVIMTGMGTDGTLGIRLLKRKGAAVIAQNKETCVVFGMPAIAVNEGLADEVLPLEEIAAHITARAGRRMVS
jgi:two-component system chemotaxis response regulator CheB